MIESERERLRVIKTRLRERVEIREHNRGWRKNTIESKKGLGNSD